MWRSRPVPAAATTWQPARRRQPTQPEPAADQTGPYKLSQQFDLSITMSSTKFSETRRIPRMYGCKQDNVSVPISWGDVS